MCLHGKYKFFPGPEPKPEFHSDNRTYRVWLDPNQYQMDMTRAVNGDEVSVSEEDMLHSIVIFSPTDAKKVVITESKSTEYVLN